jgi:hypothetical protein
MRPVRFLLSLLAPVVGGTVAAIVLMFGMFFLAGLGASDEAAVLIALIAGIAAGLTVGIPLMRRFPARLSAAPSARRRGDWS